MAAAALLLAINISSCELVSRFGMKKLVDTNLKSLFCDNLINIEVDGVRQKSLTGAGPLNIWNKVVRSTTKLSIGDDLRPAYTQLCILINDNEL